jgi:hypothetical protein
MNKVDKCQLKRISIQSGYAILTCPTTEESGGGEGFSAAGNGGSKRYDKVAVKRVKELAGSAACSGCRFFGKSPAEVNELKGREASAKAVRIMGENDLLRATAERNKLLAELGDTAVTQADAPAITEGASPDIAAAPEPGAEQQPPTIEG